MQVLRGGSCPFLVSRVSRTRAFLQRLPINRLITKMRLEYYDLILVFKGEFLSDQSLHILQHYNTWLFYPDTFRYKVLLKNRAFFLKAYLLQLISMTGIIPSALIRFIQYGGHVIQRFTGLMLSRRYMMSLS